MKKLVLIFVAALLILSPSVLAAGKVAVGTQIGYLTAKYQFTDDLSGSAGLNNFSGGGVSQTGLLAKVDYNLPKLGEVQPCMGLYYTTDGAATALTNVGLTYGISTMVTDNLSVGADLILLRSMSIPGTTVTGILPGAALNIGLYVM